MPATGNGMTWQTQNVQVQAQQSSAQQVIMCHNLDSYLRHNSAFMLSQALRPHGFRRKKMAFCAMLHLVMGSSGSFEN
jgi:hypothetical protein